MDLGNINGKLLQATYKGSYFQIDAIEKTPVFNCFDTTKSFVCIIDYISATNSIELKTRSMRAN